MPVRFFHADNIAALRTLADNSVDAVVTDPPYGLGKEPDAAAMLRDWLTEGHHDVANSGGFMGKEWDAFVPQPKLWTEVYRVLKPGGHVLAFAGTRTQDLMALGLRLAGFEIRDMAAWVFGSGFPKSLDVSKAIDKAAGAEREVIGTAKGKGGENVNKFSRVGGNDADDAKGCGAYGQGVKQVTIDIPVTAPATEEARRWEGWGTALKPALEPITVARKPLEGTVAQNVLAYGTGAINIDTCRVEPTGESRPRVNEASQERRYTENGGTNFAAKPGVRGGAPNGRHPANLIHDGSDEVMAAFAAFGEKKSCMSPSAARSPGTILSGSRTQGNLPMDSGTAARFFYCAKATKADRDGSKHPTVKPIALMRYLVRLVTPPGGVVLDPFAGSGTTGQAAVEEGFDAILIEREAEYAEDIRHRLLMYIDRDETL